MTDAYTNPVLPGFHPDPSVCRVGDDYYLVTSTFTYFPGVPIFRSRNLVDWTQIGNVLDRPSQLDLDDTRGWASMGVWAPTIRHHDGRFWMITTNQTDHGSKNFFVTADDPAGPWTDSVPLAVDGCDPELAWDVDGACWLHFSKFGIYRCRIDDSTGALLDEPEATWSGTGLQYPESPHLYEHDGVWYLMIAEGGTHSGHAVSIARGPGPAGPWEGCPTNPFLSHRSTNQPIQNTGHADLVEATDGSWWMILLGVRPRGLSPAFHVLGRETFLAPVEWIDGWPVVDEVALTVERRPPGPVEPVSDAARDEFDGPILHPRWLAVRRFPDAISSLEERPGWLTLHGDDATLDAPTPAFVGRRQQHHLCRVRARLEIGTAREAGLAVLLDDTAHYEIGVVGDQVVARARIGSLQVVLGEVERPAASIDLAVETRPSLFGPDIVVLGFEDVRGDLQIVAELDGRYLSTEVTGGFLGRVIGMYAVGGTAAFDWFDYEEVTAPITA